VQICFAKASFECSSGDKGNTEMVVINCDMGESFGQYKMGDDEGLMPKIDVANVACGFHGSDFNHMRKNVRLAKQHGVKVGAHPSLPDLQGFGRREMTIGREELTNCLLYQIGALNALLAAEGVTLNHIKPHGALYGMVARIEEIAEAVADAADVYKVPLFGKGTRHEKIYRRRGHTFVAEYYADLDYNAEGGLIVTREHDAKDPGDAAARCLRALTEGKTRSVAGSDVAVGSDAICVHFDTPNAAAIAQAVRPYLATRRCAAGRGRKRAKHEELMAIQKIFSPLPGIFYRKPAPDKPAYKSDGDTITQDDTIGLIEVMKSFHEVKAGASGKILRFLARDEEAVMAGQPIAEVDV